MPADQTLLIRVPEEFDDTQRESVGRDVIAFIKKRTSQGLDMFNRPFAPYAQSYKDSREFKIAGKSSTVNLKFTGDMLKDLSILNQGRGFVTIGFEDDDSNDKAFYAAEPRNGSRRFFGILEADLQAIISKNRRSGSNQTVSRGFLDRLARGLFDRNTG